MVMLGILLATVASFIASAGLYAVPAISALIARTSTPRPGLTVVQQMGSVVLRSLMVSCLIAGLMAAAAWTGAVAGLLLGVALSVLPFTLLLGGVVHENTAVTAAGIHFLDWIIKLAIIGAIVGACV
ncbi:DUF1761 family protein [Microbacterium murale]|uniref:DUF1761 domain-containing protein n=1 Tax=Microbacterium murale TaxID=1081040 RepID=A0ABU0PDM4_9MICO|nr:DUF1761 family protein [Microbacterium murale]MDQ0645436.1 hypothetical protein [Microbacterium murale]